VGKFLENKKNSQIFENINLEIIILYDKSLATLSNLKWFTYKTILSISFAKHA